MRHRSSRWVSRLVVGTTLLAAAPFGLTSCDEKKTPPPDPSGASSAPKEPAALADVTLPGIDTSILTPREKKEWTSCVTEFSSPCPDVPVPISQCVLEQRKCGKCSAAAKFLLKGVRNGLGKEQLEKVYKNRFDASQVKSIPVDGSPSLGPESAQVTIVEFADFECPYCAMMSPILEKIVTERKDKVRLIYKVKLLGHPHGEIAARAAFSAREQGKFWEMHHKIFENQRALEQRDLDSYAKQVGCDPAKFSSALKSDAVNAQLERDKKLGDNYKLDHTPTIYVNGRECEPTDLEEVIAEEFGETFVKPKAAASGIPSGSSSAVPPSPSAGASASSSAAAPASAAPSPSAAKPSKTK